MHRRSLAHLKYAEICFWLLLIAITTIIFPNCHVVHRVREEAWHVTAHGHYEELLELPPLVPGIRSVSQSGMLNRDAVVRADLPGALRSTAAPRWTAASRLIPHLPPSNGLRGEKGSR